MSILIKNGRIITATDNYQADIFIEGEKIAQIGTHLNVTADQVIDANGMLVFPGAIDPHVHLDMPFMGTFSSDSYETGTRAALFGGTTTVIDFVLQTQGKSLRHALTDWQSRATGTAVGDYSFHMAVTDFNEHTKAEVREMVEQEGITSFKTFMAYKGALMIDDRQMVGLMQEVKKCGGMVTVHATNGDVIDYLVAKHRAEGKLSPLYHYISQPEVTEAEASARFADLANYTGVQAYIVHLTCEGASAKWVMSPPLREPKDQATLWAGINQGLVRVVATDHCPFKWQQKLMGEHDFSKIPNGHPAIEHRVELLFSEGVKKGRISANKFVEVLATNPAKLFGMFPQKGTIAVGTDADIVIFDPNKEHTISAKNHHMNVDYSSYEGWKLTGKCKTVLLRGKVAIDNNKCLVDKGYGKYIKRKPNLV